MDRRILAIVLLVAISSGLCATTDNIFNNKYTNSCTDEEREERLSEGDLDPVFVASLFAKSANKMFKVPNSDVTINDLLKLAEFDRQSARDCTRARAEEYERTCMAVHQYNLRYTYDYYADYCNYCFEKLYEHCAGLGHYKEFEGLTPAMFDGLGNEEDNIFGVEYDDWNDFEALLYDLDYDDMHPKGIAELLAQSDNKRLELAPYVSINTLLRLAEIDRNSAKDCTRQRVDKSREVCKQLEGAKYVIGLVDYCLYCNEKLFEHCSAKGYRELFKGFWPAVFEEPGNPKENIFGVEYGDSDNFAHLIGEYYYPEDMDFEQIADIMAKSYDKSSEVAPGVSMSLLLRLAEFDRRSTKDCNRERVVESKKICKTIRDNGFRTLLDLTGYCNYCVDQLMQHCAAKGLTDLVQ